MQQNAGEIQENRSESMRCSELRDRKPDRSILFGPGLHLRMDSPSHEWRNGTGYPLGLKGEDIPLECRILSIVDAFDAMTNDRPYRKAMPIEDALTELKKFSGIQFDPTLVKRFAKIIKEEHEAEAPA